MITCLSAVVLTVVGYRCDYMPVSCGVDSGRVQV